MVLSPAIQIVGISGEEVEVGRQEHALRSCEVVEGEVQAVAHVGRDVIVGVAV
jgi:hypothetical protein